jgi:hypothetical protein
LIRRNLDFFLSRREEKGEQREKVYVGERFTVLFIQVVYQWYSSPVVSSRRVVVVAFVERYPYLIVFDVPECRRLITCPLDNVSARPRKKKKKYRGMGTKMTQTVFAAALMFVTKEEISKGVRSAVGTRRNNL